MFLSQIIPDQVSRPRDSVHGYDCVDPFCDLSHGSQGSTQREISSAIVGGTASGECRGSNNLHAPLASELYPQ